MAESGGRMRWLKIGCLGCLGVVGLVILVAATLSGVAYLRVKAEKVAERTLTPDLPTRELASSEPVEAPSAPEPDLTEVLRSMPAAAGHVELDLQGGGFWIEPGPEGEPLRVEARYDENYYSLEEQLDDRAEEGWHYRLVFRKTGSTLLMALKEMFGGTTPEVRVYLPPDLPIALDLKLSQGGSKVELGGLWLTTADVEFGQAGLDLGFKDPLRAPIERLSLHGGMGGVDVEKVGNASPRELSVDYGMGGMNLDLRGHWVTDSTISITTRMSGTRVQLPRDVRIEGLDQAFVGISPEPEIEPPTLRFTVSGEDIEFR